jgi:hypothetical protein
MQISARDVGYLAFNFFSAIFIISVNKLVVSASCCILLCVFGLLDPYLYTIRPQYRAGFTYPIVLSLFQYIVNYIFLVGLKMGGYFVPRRAGRITPKLLLLAAALGTATPVSNLSLKLNSVGVYTIAKLLVTPGIVMAEWVLRGKTISCTRACLLVIVAIGVAINSMADLELTYEGTVVLAVWLPVAVVYKVGWSVACKEDSWQTFPLMYELYPYAIGFTAILCPMLDNLGEVAELKWLTVNSAAMLMTSGFGAFLVNVSGFLVMGGLSPLTHVILGQLKATVRGCSM